MQAIKTLLFMLGIVITMTIVAVSWVILPIFKKHEILKQQEDVLALLVQKDDEITNEILHNRQYSHILQNHLEENTAFAFLQAKLNAAHLPIESVKFTKFQEYEDIHLTFQGTYRNLVTLLSLLANQPNSMEITALLVEKNHMYLGIKNRKHQKLISESPQFSFHCQQVKELILHLVPVTPPVLSLVAKNSEYGVQSPFIPRMPSRALCTSIQSLARYQWHCVGEVRQQGQLLGVFLQAQDQSYYFGVGLTWENTAWRVVDVQQHAILFEQGYGQKRWKLTY